MRGEKRFKGQEHRQWGDIKRKGMVKWGLRDRSVDALSALFSEFSSGTKTIYVGWLWMSQAPLLCLLYLVPLTAATIHLYSAADAPNHSILPLIYLDTTPLENSSCPSSRAFCWSVHPSVFPCIPPSVQTCVFSWSPPSTWTSMCTCALVQIYRPVPLIILIQPIAGDAELYLVVRRLSQGLNTTATLVQTGC